MLSEAPSIRNGRWLVRAGVCSARTVAITADTPNAMARLMTYDERFMNFLHLLCIRPCFAIRATPRLSGGTARWRGRTFAAPHRVRPGQWRRSEERRVGKAGRRG